MNCDWCDQPVIGEGIHPRMHNACMMRSIMGGLNHQRRICTCYGGEHPPDPPCLSKREAALVAYAYRLALTDAEEPQ